MNFETGKLFKISTKNGKWVNLPENIQYGIILTRDYTYGDDYSIKVLLGEKIWLLREKDIEEIF